MRRTHEEVESFKSFGSRDWYIWWKFAGPPGFSKAAYLETLSTAQASRSNSPFKAKTIQKILQSKKHARKMGARKSMMYMLFEGRCETSYRIISFWKVTIWVGLWWSTDFVIKRFFEEDTAKAKIESLEHLLAPKEDNSEAVMSLWKTAIGVHVSFGLRHKHAIIIIFLTRVTGVVTFLDDV